MGGPWRDRGFDVATWRPPAPRIPADGDPSGRRSGEDLLRGIVVGFTAGLVLTFVAMLAFMQQ